MNFPYFSSSKLFTLMMMTMMIFPFELWQCSGNFSEILLQIWFWHLHFFLCIYSSKFVLGISRIWAKNRKLNCFFFHLRAHYLYSKHFSIYKMYVVHLHSGLKRDFWHFKLTKSKFTCTSFNAIVLFIFCRAQHCMQLTIICLSIFVCIVYEHAWCCIHIGGYNILYIYIKSFLHCKIPKSIAIDAIFL